MVSNCIPGLRDAILTERGKIGIAARATDLILGTHLAENVAFASKDLGQRQGSDP
jgi:hypothetical protein